MSSDRDESKDISTGAQVLPVAELPMDFSGEVADGAQYLFTVRREAARIPNQKRVLNPYEGVQVAGSNTQSSSHSFTHSEWQQSYSANFKKLRSLIATIKPPPLSHLPHGYMPFPGKKDRSGWINYINNQSHEPKISILKSLTCVSAITLMTFLVEDAQQNQKLGDLQTRWLVFLMASRPEDFSGNLVSNLRVLARGVMSLININNPPTTKNTWMVLMCVIGGFGQADLYNEID
ncbi:hypothetical protein E3P77_00453 [Wallemia ichthyophaga]|uniref:Gem-associated protein 2 n=1 Tax=Wallemia ichthyophaga TaxID=245174 RepID=A0A4T0HNM0_WALIC|nr:hypothetical protein E3P98_00422 [Wallemia ichthyophaga]TIA95630.1 hypothetical protein E3P94_03989 [Wallemia ichthyophaga]TIA97081.1 hypothetical protein E3P95_03012 [Wallemia ichthyophaga]TIB16292.1 hypothetical protein E3P90_00568 [Wallemia ichthyophaga]TIB18028.1 hypothetical protein E3P93_00425 [Wallemia ichthyophaga]